MKKLLEKIDYMNPETKHKVNDYLEMLMCNAKETDRGLYDHVKCELYEMVYGKVLNDDMAEKWVAHLNPSGRWTKDETTNVVRAYNLNIPEDDAYVLFNMLYSDNKNVYGEGDTEESLMRYIEGAKDWYFDEDSKHTGREKLYMYGKHIVGIV